MKLTDKVLLISGASRGIGAEIARQAVARGARVGLLARNAADLGRMRDELGDRCVVAPADICSPDELATAVDTISAELGPIDGVVCNAGIGLYGAFLDADVADLERVMNTNYLGTVYLLKAVLPGMVARRTGHVAVIGSISGRIGSPFEAGYSASKFAQTGLAEALMVELSPYDIGVSLVLPGPVESSFFEARGVPYERSHPKQESPVKVARVTLDCIERNRPEAYVSGFMRQAFISKTLVPPLFAWGTARAFAKELAETRARVPQRP